MLDQRRSDKCSDGFAKTNTRLEDTSRSKKIMEVPIILEFVSQKLQKLHFLTEGQC